MDISKGVGMGIPATKAQIKATNTGVVVVNDNNLRNLVCKRA